MSRVWNFAQGLPLVLPIRGKKELTKFSINLGEMGKSLKNHFSKICKNHKTWLFLGKKFQKNHIYLYVKFYGTPQTERHEEYLKNLEK